VSIAAAHAPHHGRTFWFVRHLVEMAVAMGIGMVVYALLVSGLLIAAGGGSYRAARVDQPALFALGMALSMSVPMVAWMRARGHGWRSSAEMTAAMFGPAVVLIVCHRLGAVSAAWLCPIACMAMIPAMTGAMALRLDEYTHYRPVAAG
jgi:hypothetical protein